jgi:hypothetical protein
MDISVRCPSDIWTSRQDSASLSITQLVLCRLKWCCRHVHVLTHTSLSPFRLEGTLPQVPRLRMRQLVPQYKKRLNSESRVPISNSFYKWKGLSENPSAKVLGGWHRGSPNCLGGRRYTKTWEATGKTYTRRPSIICFFGMELTWIALIATRCLQSRTRVENPCR